VTNDGVKTSIGCVNGHGSWVFPFSIPLEGLGWPRVEEYVKVDSEARESRSDSERECLSACVSTRSKHGFNLGVGTTSQRGLDSACGCTKHGKPRKYGDRPPRLIRRLLISSGSAEDPFWGKPAGQKQTPMTIETALQASALG
jgi:hypothetical protein